MSPIAERCPLCAGRLRPSRTRPVHFAGQEFRYLRCTGCRSLVCDPMPGPDVLTLMYGPDYGASDGGHYDVDSPRDTAAVVDFLNRHPPGRVLDFGCGHGDLLAAIADGTAWTPIGVELEPSIAAQAQARTGVTVLTYDDLLAGRVGTVQALHLGDVIEHLTELDRQMPSLLDVIELGGHLLAEGPLQCGPTLFEASIQASQALRASAPIDMPPHHVLQATAAGQRSFFRRHGLIETSFDVYEVDWPAPSRLRREDLRQPRTLALFSLRKASRMLSRKLSWGNRYRYVGQVTSART